MDKWLVPTKEDQKLALKREYRLKQEQKRKSRIFNPRARLIGIDKDSLDQIVEEKQHQIAMQQREEMSYANEMKRQAEMLDSQMEQANEEEMHRQQEINQFRSSFQRKEQSREFDLNDPLYLKKVSLHVDGHWPCGDPDDPQRIRQQKELQNTWLKQQISEKNQLKKQMSDAERITQASSSNRNTQLKEKQFAEKKKRQQVQFETATYNLRMAQDQKQKQIETKRRDEEDNLAEIMNNLSSDMFAEQLERVRREQRRHIEEKNLELAKIKKNETLADESGKYRANLIDTDEQSERKKRQQMRLHQNSVNAQLLEEQKQRNHHLNSEVYKFTPTEAYYEQFNSTTR